MKRAVPRMLAAALLLFLLPCLAVPARAGKDQDLETMNALVSKYGKANLVALVMERRSGSVTIRQDSGMADFHGKPGMEFISAETLLSDVEKMGMTVTRFAAIAHEDAKVRMERYTRAMEREAEQLIAEKNREMEQQQRKEEAVLERKVRLILEEGTRQFNNGNLIAAHNLFTQAIELSQDNPETWYARSRVWLARKRWDSAIRDADKALFLDPGHVHAMFVRGQANLEKGLPARTVADMDRILAKDPASHEALFWKARALEAEGRLDQARQAAEKALALAPDFLQYQYYVQTIRAARDIQQGRTKADTGGYALAIEDFDKALTVDPFNSEGYLERGKAYLAMGNNAKALADMDRVLEFSPGNPEAYYWRSRALEARDDLDQALHNAQMALAQQPDNERYRERIEQLRSRVSATSQLNDRLVTVGITIAGLALLFLLFKGVTRTTRSLRMRALREKEKKEALAKESTAAPSGGSGGKSQLEARIKSAILETPPEPPPSKAGDKDRDSGDGKGGKKDSGLKGSIDAPPELNDPEVA